jgi:hypothetical protein
MALKIVAGIGLALTLLAVVIAMRPSAFRVARSITINARPEDAFALVNDFREWPAWSPYEKIDPKVTWAMEGRNNFLFKAVGLFMNVDALVGAEFEKGLRALKTQSENASKQGTNVATAAN